MNLCKIYASNKEDISPLFKSVGNAIKIEMLIDRTMNLIVWCTSRSLVLMEIKTNTYIHGNSSDKEYTWPPTWSQFVADDDISDKYDYLWIAHSWNLGHCSTPGHKEQTL